MKKQNNSTNSSELNPNPKAEFDYLVKAFESEMAKVNIKIKHTEAIEIISRSQGFHNYNEVKHLISKDKRNPNFTPSGPGLLEFKSNFLKTINIHYRRLSLPETSPVFNIPNIVITRYIDNHLKDVYSGKIGLLIDEIDKELPKLEDFDLPQPNFNTMFTTNLFKIEGVITDFSLIKLENTELIHTQYRERNKRRIQELVIQIFIEPLARQIDLLEVPKNIKVLRENEWVEIYTPALKINNATGNIILQQTPLDSYKVFREELNYIDINKINLLFNQLLLEISKYPVFINPEAK